MNENISLRTCSRCKCTLLEKYFSVNRKGVLFKLCNNCRSKGQRNSTLEKNTTATDIVENLLRIYRRDDVKTQLETLLHLCGKEEKHI